MLTLLNNVLEAEFALILGFELILALDLYVLVSCLLSISFSLAWFVGILPVRGFL